MVVPSLEVAARQLAVRLRTYPTSRSRRGLSMGRTEYVKQDQCHFCSTAAQLSTSATARRSLTSPLCRIGSTHRRYAQAVSWLRRIHSPPRGGSGADRLLWREAVAAARAQRWAALADDPSSTPPRPQRRAGDRGSGAIGRPVAPAGSLAASGDGHRAALPRHVIRSRLPPSPAPLRSPMRRRRGRPPRSARPPSQRPPRCRWTR